MVDENRGMFNGRVSQKNARTFDGKKILNLTIAVNYYDRKEKEEKPIFIKASIFGQQAEYMDAKADKGDLVHLEGEWRPNNWIGQHGEKHNELRLSVEKCQLLCKKGNRSGAETAGEGSASTVTDSTADNSMSGFYPIDNELEDDDLPF